MQILCLRQSAMLSLWNSQGAAGSFKQIVTMGWKSAGRGDTVIKLFHEPALSLHSLVGA